MELTGAEVIDVCLDYEIEDTLGETTYDNSVIPEDWSNDDFEYPIPPEWLKVLGFPLTVLSKTVLSALTHPDIANVPIPERAKASLLVV